MLHHTHLPGFVFNDMITWYEITQGKNIYTCKHYTSGLDPLFCRLSRVKKVEKILIMKIRLKRTRAHTMILRRALKIEAVIHYLETMSSVNTSPSSFESNSNICLHCFIFLLLMNINETIQSTFRHKS
jgi:hypothetical protein